MSWSPRRLNTIAQMIDAKNYLEIGVMDGSTFLEIEIEHKDAVDPNFKFDTAVHATDTVRFFPVVSDTFWTSDNPKTYDLMMIDGLHTFEQTFRDVLCSMRFAHPRTVWLIDDTVPQDVFSAMPDQRQCYRERQAVGLGGWHWHGDVYKVVAALHDFMPALDYVTIMGSGNPQTLAWFGARPNFAPRFGSLEAISRMTYFDIAPNVDVFNHGSEEDALKKLELALNA